MILDLMTVVTVMTSLYAGVIAVTTSPYLIWRFHMILKNNPSPKTTHELMICNR